MNRSWRDLRGDARSLESKIDAALSAYNRLGASFSEPHGDWMEKYNEATGQIQDLLQKYESFSPHY